MPPVNIFSFVVLAILSLPPEVGVPLLVFALICVSVIPSGLLGTIIGFLFLLPSTSRKKLHFFKIFIQSFILNSIIFWPVYIYVMIPQLVDKYLMTKFEVILCLQPVFFLTALYFAWRMKKELYHPSIE